MSSFSITTDRRNDKHFKKEEYDEYFKKELITNDLVPFVHKLILIFENLESEVSNSLEMNKNENSPSLLLDLLNKTHDVEESIKQVIEDAFYNILIDDLEEYEEACDVECSDDEDNLDGLELNSFDKFINFIGLKGCKNLDYDTQKILRDEYINIVFYLILK